MALASVRNLVITGHRIIRRYPVYQTCRYPSSQCILNQVSISDAIGDREIVGYGKNGEFMYIDHPAFPFPAVRWCEMSPDLLGLREKEKGDWRSLSLEEKKTLYRASFCQTYAEMLAPTGKWKSTIGFALIYVSIGIWLFLLIRALWHTELPDSFLKERQKEQLDRMLILEVNPICGLSSKWDYKNKKWK